MKTFQTFAFALMLSLFSCQPQSEIAVSHQIPTSKLELQKMLAKDKELINVIQLLESSASYVSSKMPEMSKNDIELLQNSVQIFETNSNIVNKYGMKNQLNNDYSELKSKLYKWSRNYQFIQSRFSKEEMVEATNFAIQDYYNSKMKSAKSNNVCNDLCPGTSIGVIGLNIGLLGFCGATSSSYSEFDNCMSGNFGMAVLAAFGFNFGMCAYCCLQPSNCR